MSLAAILIAVAQAAAPVVAQPVREIASGVYLLPGGFAPGRGPDGNTVIFQGRRGLVVVDTGRHAWHSDAILAFARERGDLIGAIVNTHWHLDHSSGNGRIQAEHPDAMVYTTNAVDRVLLEGGFLMRNLEGARAMLDDPELSAVTREEVQIFLDTMEESHVLRPNVLLERSTRLSIGGRRLDVHVTDGAVTDADVWLYDHHTRVAVIGDLVTFPAPFFETACPEAWRAALDDVWATPFDIVIPGHGEPMNREEFGVWRGAYGAFIDCAMGDAEVSACAAAWAQAIAQFTAGNPRAERAALQMAEYYVGFLRENGGRSPDCLPD